MIVMHSSKEENDICELSTVAKNVTVLFKAPILDAYKLSLTPFAPPSSQTIHD